MSPDPDVIDPDGKDYDDIDRGVAARAVLQRRAERARAARQEAAGELSTTLSDQQALLDYGLDLDALRRGIDLDQPWLLR